MISGYLLLLMYSLPYMYCTVYMFSPTAALNKPGSVMITQGMGAGDDNKQTNSWILNDLGRNSLPGKRKKIAKFLMRTFTYRSTFLYGFYLGLYLIRRDKTCHSWDIEVKHQLDGCDYLTHRVGRVLSFFSRRRNWDSPNPSPAGEWAPPPFGSGGRGTLAGERGVGRLPIPTRGQTLWYSLYIRTLWSYLSLSAFCPEQTAVP